MTKGQLRAWGFVHRWTSLVCTGFLLMLCVTGLPLIFHDEIDALTEPKAALAADRVGAADRSLVPLDAIMRSALAARPGEVGLFMSFDEDRPVVNVTTAPSVDAPEAQMTLRSYDRRDGAPAGDIALEGDGVMDILLRLHVDMFLGLPGTLFLGAMGVLFTAAIVSGVVLYAPFTRKLAFGTVRATRPRRVRWLDAHNLLGIAALGWATVVGLTGVVNTLATPIFKLWQADDLAALTAAYRDRPPVTRPGSLTAAVDAALAAAPKSRPQFVAFPGGAFSSPHHYAVFLQGGTPLTKRLLTPALVDARTGALTAIRPLPWYAQALLLSQPLHFGDYGGLPLKILWALLDLMTIAVLASGLYLWIVRGRATASAARRAYTEAATLAPAE